MLTRITQNLRHLIVSTIISALVLTIGIVLIPVVAIPATVLITIASLAILFFGYHIVRYIIDHRPERTEDDEPVVARTTNWRDIVITLTLIGVIVIIVLLLFKGCGTKADTIDVLNVNTLNVETENVGTSNITTENVETENVETSNVTTENVETENVETSNVETENVVNQDVETSNVTEQEVIHQTVVEQDVETSNVTEQIVVNQQVTTQTVEKTEQPKVEEPKSEAPSTPVHVCSVANTNKVDATCTTEGKIEGVCSCGKVLSTTTVPATGHSWDDGKVTLKATEKRTGTKTYTCKKCGETKTETLEKLEHVCKIDDTIEIEATCTTKGKIKYICSCGEVLDTETTPKLGHDYEVISEKDATATTDGYVKYRCDNCGDTYKDVIPATGEEEEPEIKLSANSFVISDGKTVKVTTTGDSSDLRLQQSMDQLNMRVVSDTQVELTVKTPGVGGTVSVYDVNTGASVEIVIEFIYD